MRTISTFSVVAHDPESQSWGVAVQSKFFAVGTIVPWARAECGVVATQAMGDPVAGQRGLDLLCLNLSADDVITELTREDPKRDTRQFGVVDSLGNAAAYTGSNCIEVADHYVGDGFACQGNMLEPGVLHAMTEVMETKRTGESLAERMMAALRAGQEAGGDKRGRQAAALLVVKKEAGFGGGNDRQIDLRVDHHHSPIKELGRLLELHDAYLGHPKPDGFVPYESISPLIYPVVREFEAIGYEEGDFWQILEDGNLTHLYDRERNRLDPRIPELLSDQLQARVQE